MPDPYRAVYPEPVGPMQPASAGPPFGANPGALPLAVQPPDGYAAMLRPEEALALAQYFSSGMVDPNQTPINNGDRTGGPRPHPVSVGEIANLLGMVAPHERGMAMGHAARLFGVGTSGRAR